jgi:hypothetical protein
MLIDYKYFFCLQASAPVIKPPNSNIPRNPLPQLSIHVAYIRPSRQIPKTVSQNMTQLRLSHAVQFVIH